MAAAFALDALISENWQRKSVGKFVTNTEASSPPPILSTLRLRLHRVVLVIVVVAVVVFTAVVSCCWIKIAQP